MRIAEELAEKLAQDVIAAQKQLGNDRLVDEISKILEASSTTMQEAFLTAARVILSEERARQYLDQQIETAIRRAKAAQAAKPAAKPE